MIDREPEREYGMLTGLKQETKNNLQLQVCYESVLQVRHLAFPSDSGIFCHYPTKNCLLSQEEATLTDIAIDRAMLKQQSKSVLFIFKSDI